MKIHLCFATLFWFKLAASLHQDATSHLRSDCDTTADMPVQAKHKEVHDQRNLAAGALTGLVLYDTSTKTNITLTNNTRIVSADPKYTVVARLSGTAGIESSSSGWQILHQRRKHVLVHLVWQQWEQHDYMWLSKVWDPHCDGYRFFKG
jgi:hypothetical protein